MNFGRICFLFIFLSLTIFTGYGELKTGSIVGDKYLILEKLNSGGFGQVFKGRDVNTNKLVAIKLHNKQKSRYFITNEVKYYQYLEGIEGIPEILWYGKQDGSRAIVMELLGDNLETYLWNHNGTLTIPQVSQIAISILLILKEVHSRFLLHRDIKPKNIVFGYQIENDFQNIYLIDFGLSQFYATTNPSQLGSNSHIPFSDHNIHGNISGTPRFASLSVLIGYTPSRRDDLESLGYTLLHLLRAKDGLWNYDGNYFIATSREQTFDIRTSRWKMLQFKMTQTIEELCEGLPVAYQQYFSLVRSLGFYETPNYDLLISLFSSLVS